MFDAHVAAIRRIRPFEHLPILLIIERYGDAAETLGTYAKRRYGNSIITHSDPRTGAYGIFKTAEQTMNMMCNTHKYLLEGRLLRSQYLFTTSRQFDRNPDRALTHLATQMRAYKWETANKHPGALGPGRMFLSGKSGGRNDDLLITVLMMCSVPQVILVLLCVFTHRRCRHPPPTPPGYLCPADVQRVCPGQHPVFVQHYRRASATLRPIINTVSLCRQHVRPTTTQSSNSVVGHCHSATNGKSATRTV